MDSPVAIDTSRSIMDSETEPATPPSQHRALLPVYEAALAIASELRIDAVLQRIVDLAREIVPAKYAALGVCDEEGRITQFITSGIDPETVARIGPLPHGTGCSAS